MLDDASGILPGADQGPRNQDAGGGNSFTVVIESTFGDGVADDGSIIIVADPEVDGVVADEGLATVGLHSKDDSDSTGDASFSVDFADAFGSDDDDHSDDVGASELGFGATSEDFGNPAVDLSPWAPLLGMLDSTEPEPPPGDWPFSPTEGVERAHALELRAESMLQYSERGAERTGELDRTEVGFSDENRDIVAGRDDVEIDGMLEEHTGHGLVHVADEVELNVRGPMRVQAHLEDNIIMAGVMRDEWCGGTLVTATMSDDMAAGLGLRCTAPLDVWVHGLVGMEERPGTCAADGILNEIAGTLYEREYGPSAHGALVARYQGTVVTTMKTGFRPLMKTAIGVRNLIPGGGGGGASASPPASPPAPGGGEAAGAGAVTLTAVEGGGALGRGAAGSGDTEEIVSVARTAESASRTTEIENLQHPASTADNLDDLARVEVEGTGYQQVAEIYEQPIPASAVSEPDGGESVHSRLDTLEDSQTGEGALVEPHRIEGNSDLDAWSDGGIDGDEFAHQAVAGGENRIDPDIVGPDGAAAPGADAHGALPSGRPSADASPAANSAPSGAPFPTPRPDPLDRTAPGTDGYDFARTYDSLLNRKQYYRDHTNWRGNLFLREATDAIDKRALDLFNGLGGSLDDVRTDTTSRTVAIRNALEAMAEQAATAGDTERAAKIRGAIDELDEFTHGKIVEMANRADEFSGAALGSQRVPIDRQIDTDMLRSWFQEQLTKADDKLMAAQDLADADAGAVPGLQGGWEKLYYDQMIRSLDKGVNPLTDSNELVIHVREKVRGYYLSYGFDIDEFAKSDWGILVPRSKDEDQLDLLIELHGLLVTTLSDPEYIRGVDDVGASTFTSRAHRRIQWELDILEPDSLQPAADGEPLPPLPAPNRSSSVGDLDTARNEYFSRSTLSAGEDTLERQVLDFSEQSAAGPSRSSSSGLGSEGSGTPGGSPRNHRAPPDNAQAPVIDEQSAQWIVEPPGGTDTTPTTSDSASPLAHGNGTSSQVSWDSGIRESDDSAVGVVAGDADDAVTADLFKAPSEPNDVNADEAQYAAAASDGSSGSPAAGSNGPGGTNPNPTGTVSEPTDSITTTSGMGTGTEPGSSGTSPGTPDPVSTGTHAFEAPAPYLGFDPNGDASATPGWARDDFEVERALIEGRLPPEFDRSGLGEQWTRSMTDS